MFKAIKACVLLLGGVACDVPRDAESDEVCSPYASCGLPSAWTKQEVFEVRAASVGVFDLRNVGVGLLRLGHARLVEPCDGVTIDFAVVPFDAPVDDWTPIHRRTIEVPSRHSILWRAHTQAAGDCVLMMDANDPDNAEITIPIRVR